MGTEWKRKVSLFDVVDDDSAIAKLNKANGRADVHSSVPMVNRWNGRPYSQGYYDILEKRKTLSVLRQKDEFLKALKENQTLILVGETGSGKTTQLLNCLDCDRDHLLERKSWRVCMITAAKITTVHPIGFSTNA